jgi:hypothetical protein
MIASFFRCISHEGKHVSTYFKPLNKKLYPYIFNGFDVD